MGRARHRMTNASTQKAPMKDMLALTAPGNWVKLAKEKIITVMRTNLSAAVFGTRRVWRDKIAKPWYTLLPTVVKGKRNSTIKARWLCVATAGEVPIISWKT